MQANKKRADYFETVEGTQYVDMLRAMSADVAFNTENSYTADSVRYPDNIMSFLDKHKNYLLAHPDLDPMMYLANLRLKTRLR